MIHLNHGIVKKNAEGERCPLVLKDFVGGLEIPLAWDDTYTVRLLSSKWNEKVKFENVYCDDLAELIDTKIERIKEYNK
jgi:hypothetical protein